MPATYNPSVSRRAVSDEGLRAYMLRVYDLFGVGLTISAVSAWLILSMATTTTPVAGAKAFTKSLWLTPLGETLFSGPALIALLVVSIGLIFGMASAIKRASFPVALTLYVVFTAIFGLDLAIIVAKYTTASVVQALAATAVTFGAVSLWGYTTKRDISGWGGFLFMGLIGLIAVGLINVFFIQSTVMQTVMSGVGVLLFIGFIAYDTQTIKEAYSDELTGDNLNSVALWGALDLYLDAVNLFTHLLGLFGDKDD